MPNFGAFLFKIARSHFEILEDSIYVTAQKMKFPIKYFFGKCDQIRTLVKAQIVMRNIVKTWKQVIGWKRF